MKHPLIRTFSLIICLLLLTQAHAQNKVNKFFLDTFGTSRNLGVVTTDSESYIIAAGFLHNSPYQNSSMYKVDVQNQISWLFNYKKQNVIILEDYNSINFNSDSTGFSLCGGQSNGTGYIWIRSLEGDSILFKEIKDTSYIYGIDYVYQFPDKSYWVGGKRSTIPNDNTYTYPMLLKLDSAGNELWRQVYTYSNYASITKIVKYNENKYLLGCFDAPIHYLTNVLCVDTLGNILWNKNYGPAGAVENGTPTDFIVKKDGDILISAWSCKNLPDSSGSINYCQSKIYTIDSLGTLKSTKTIGDYSPSLAITAMKLDADSNLFISFEKGVPYNHLQGAIMKLDKNLDSIWMRSYTYYDCKKCNNDFFDMTLTADSGIVAVGVTQYYTSDSVGYERAWYVKTDWTGCELENCTLSIAPKSENTSGINIFPNPANDKLQVSSDEIVKQCLFYDISGKVIMTIDSFQGSKNIDVSNMSDGLYLLKVKFVNGEERSKKINILH
jgi:hypothetical protein